MLESGDHPTSTRLFAETALVVVFHQQAVRVVGSRTGIAAMASIFMNIGIMQHGWGAFKCSRPSPRADSCMVEFPSVGNLIIK